MEGNEDAILIIASAGKIAYANRAARKLFKKKLLGKTLGFPIAAGPMSRISILSGRKPVAVELKVAAVAWSGKPAHFVTLRDITDRLQFIEARNHLAAIVDSSEDAVFSQDVDGRVLSWNRGAEKLYGFRRSEMVGKIPGKVTPPDGALAFGRARAAALRGRGSVNLESEGVKKGGGRIPLSLTVSPIMGTDGEVAGTSVIARDLSERKRAEEAIRQLNTGLERRVEERTAELAAANRDLEAFARTVSHDLRSPLLGLGGYAEILRKEFDGEMSGDGLLFLDRIVDISHRMGRMIEGLLKFARLGARAVGVREVRPAELVSEVLEEIRAGRGAGAADIVVRDLGVCRADPVLLRQVFQNLITNALKFSRTRERPRVEIGFQKSEGVWFVKDNGVGFDVKYADKLFGVFQRLHSESEFEGTGLGLANVRRIVEKHGGRVWAESVLGQGAAFFFTLAVD